jgi:tetratricopeptide (TPR) repeat protein
VWSNSKLQDAATREHNAAEEAKKQREQAKIVVDEMYTRVATRWLVDEPRMEQLQREFLEKALQFYEDYGKNPNVDSTSKLPRALAFKNAAAISEKLGDEINALTRYQHAINLLNELGREAPTPPGIRLELAKIYRDYGFVLDRNRQRTEGETAIRRGIQLSDELVAEFPTSSPYRQCLATECSDLAGVLTAQRRFEEARELLNRAIPQFESLLASASEDSENQMRFGAALHNLALIEFQENRYVQAEKVVEQAILHQESALHTSPRSLRSRTFLRNHYKLLAGVHAYARRAEDAEGMAVKVAAISERLASDFPAVPEFRRDCLWDFTNLGDVQGNWKRLKEAEQSYQKAVSYGQGLVRDFSDTPEYKDRLCTALMYLGDTLSKQGSLDDAIAAFQKATELKSDFAEAYGELGKALRRKKGALDRAIMALREAIRLKPNYAGAYINLAGALEGAHGPEEAIAVYREGLRHSPGADVSVSGSRFDDMAIRYNLGTLLARKGELDESIALIKEAIRLMPARAGRQAAEAHCQLGQVLERKGQWTQALPELRRGHELGSKYANWDHPSAQWVQDCERFAELDSRLPAVLAGTSKPADAGQTLALAQLCRRPVKGLYAASARFYAEAFALQPKLPEDYQSGHRYNAACAAARAGCGQGNDANQTDARERARLRRQAFEWLRADLAAWRQLLEKDPEKTRPIMQERLQHWQEESDLAGIRGADSLAKLPQAERQEWQKLWEEVEAHRQRALRQPADQK